jgi:hypothetical protein
MHFDVKEFETALTVYGVAQDRVALVALYVKFRANEDAMERLEFGRNVLKRTWELELVSMDAHYVESGKDYYITEDDKDDWALEIERAMEKEFERKKNNGA